MSNGNEKDNKFSAMSDEEMEQSSVFSKPETVNKKPPKSGGNIALKTVAAVAVVALLFVAIWYLNARFGKKDGSSGSVSSAVTSSDNKIKAVGYSSGDVKSVTLKNKNGAFNFYSETKQVSGSDVTTWYLKGIEKSLTDTDNTELTVGDCAELRALAKQKINNNIDYGFANPTATAEVTLKNGKKYTFTVGKDFKNSNMEGAYAKVSTDSENVYILHGENVAYFTKKYVYYVNNNAPTAIVKNDKNEKYFNGETLNSFDWITLSGSLTKSDYRFEMYGRANSSIMYVMKKPQTAFVDEAKLSGLLSILKENLEAGEVYYFNQNGIPADVIKKYSLKDPLATISYKVGAKTVEIKLAQSATDTNYYAMTVSGVPAIYKVSRLSFDFLEYEPVEFMTDSVLLDKIAGLKNIVVSTDKKEYELKLTTTTKDDVESTSAKYGNKEIKAENLSNFYQYVMSVHPYLSNTSILTKAPGGISKYFSVKLVPSGSDSSITMTVYRIKDNSARYYIELDGTPIGLCERTGADRVCNSIENLVNGKSIAEIQ